MQLLAKKSTTAEHTAKLHLGTLRDCESRILVVDSVHNHGHRQRLGKLIVFWLAETRVEHQFDVFRVVIRDVSTLDAARLLGCEPVALAQRSSCSTCA